MNRTVTLGRLWSVAAVSGPVHSAVSLTGAFNAGECCPPELLRDAWHFWLAILSFVAALHIWMWAAERRTEK